MGSEASTVGWFDQEMSHFVGGFQVSWGTEAAKMLSSPIKILDLSGATKIGERNQQRWRHNQEQRRAWQPKMRLDFFSNAPNFRSVIKLRMFTLVPGFGAFFCDSPSWDRSSPGLSMHATKAQRLHLLVPRRDNDRHKTQNLRFPGPKTLNHTHFKVRDLLPFALWNMKFKASTWACPSIGSYQKLRNIGVYSHFQPCPNIIWMVTSIIYPIDSNGKNSLIHITVIQTFNIIQLWYLIVRPTFFRNATMLFWMLLSFALLQLKQRTSTTPPSTSSAALGCVLANLTITNNLNNNDKAW